MTLWAVKAPMLRPIMTYQQNLHGHYCSSSSLCNKPKTSRFSGWTTEQQLPITSTQTESHRVVSGPPRLLVLKSHENGSLQKRHNRALWVMTRLSLRCFESILSAKACLSLAADEVSVLDHIQAPHEVTEQSLLRWLGAAPPDLRGTWCSFTAGCRLPEWAGLSHRENPHTLWKCCTWLTKFLRMLLNQIWILWSSLLYVHKVSPAVGIVRCGTDHLPWTLSDRPHGAEQQEPTRWCKIHQFDSWDYFLKYKYKFQEMRELMWPSSQERLFE